MSDPQVTSMPLLTLDELYEISDLAPVSPTSTAHTLTQMYGDFTDITYKFATEMQNFIM